MTEKETKKSPRHKTKKKNVGKVAKIKAKNPHATTREIAKATGLARNTVMDANKILSQDGTKDETIQYIVGASKARIKRVQGIFDRYVKQIESQKQLDRKDIALAKDILKDDQARVTVFGGGVTDEQGGYKSIQDMMYDEGLQD